MHDLEQLARVFALLNPNNRGVAWTAKSPSGRAMVGSTSHSVQQFQKHLAQQDGWNLFVCLNPTSRTTTKPGKADITHIQCIGIDMDPLEKGATIDIPVAAPALDAGITEYTRGINNHIIIGSGRGLWAWVFVEAHPTATPADQEAADQIIKQFVYGFTEQATALRTFGRIDHSCAEISRIARCPGTQNLKPGASMANILIDYTPIAPIPWDAIVAIAEPFARRMPEAQAPTKLTGRSLHEIVPHCNTTTRTFILLGVNSADESRHRRAFSAAKNLFELQVEPDLAEFALWSGASRCIPDLNKDDPGCIKAIVKQVWKR